MKKLSIFIITLVIIFTCFSCKYQIEFEHTYDDNYEYNEEYHWQVCTTCKETSKKTKHDFGVTTTSEGKTYKCNVCDYQYVEKNSGEDPVTPDEPDDPVETGFKVTFSHDDKVKVYIYDTQDTTSNGKQSDEAWSKDGDTGALLSDGNGQVNFRLEIADGYDVDQIVFDDTKIKNMKTIDATNYIYRATKITADTTIEIKIKEKEPEVVIEAYKVTFSHQSNVSIIVYDTQDTTVEGVTTDSCYSKDGDTGAYLKDGNGQVNFKVVLSDADLEIKEIKFDSNVIKNLKEIDATNYIYRATKITADTTIEIVVDYKEGTFEDTKSNFSIEYVEGTNNAYSTKVNKNGETEITFTTITEDTVYAISGTLYGNIIINPVNEFAFELDLTGFTLNASNNTPIVILSGDEVTISSKKSTTNVINDTRSAVLDTDETQYSGCIYSMVDLTLSGKGSLKVVSTNNNGIHTKDDLEIKNVTLEVTCIDNALKGNDGVKIESGAITLISKQGDGIKTSNSKKKYEEDGTTLKKIQGDVNISGGEINIYAACDGIDAAHDVIIDGDATVLNIFTDKYSEYSEEVTSTSDNELYIRTSSSNQKISLYFINENNEGVWKNASYYTSKQSQSRGFYGGSTTYYYYKVEVPSGYQYFVVYLYNSGDTQGQNSSYKACSQTKAINSYYDTVALTISSSTISISWTMFEQQSMDGGPGGGGPGGGPNEGNSDKGDYSTKGLKSDNEIIINNGTINIKSYDDAIHTNKDVVLGDEDDTTDDYYGTGDIFINGGTITCYSNDDGIHADGMLTVNGGLVNVTKSYEGLEGTYIRIKGGSVGVVSSDDGFNATTTSGVGIEISGGNVYVYAGGDGLDSNSTTSSKGIVFSGGNTIVLQTSGGNSAIDTERGYSYTGGSVLALGYSGGMTSESTNVSTSLMTQKSLTTGSYVTVKLNGTVKLVVKMPKSYSAKAVYLGSSSATIESSTSASYDFDTFGVYWNN